MSGGQGFQVEPDALRGCADELRRLRERATNILKLAEDANPEWYIWGLLGAPLAALYWAHADDLYQHLAMMGEALADRAEALQCSADTYQQLDDDLTKAFQSLQELLD
jgi:hypothetical protein